MIVHKLWNKEITPEIIDVLIKKSMEHYKFLLQQDLDNEKNRSNFINFMTDDIYEFDCITKFAYTMMNLNIEFNFWTNIRKKTQQYNIIINENSELTAKLQQVIKHYNKDTPEYRFLQRILNSNRKSGYSDTSIDFKKLLQLINQLEDDIINGINTEYSIIKLNRNEIDGIPTKYVEQFYNDKTNTYDIKVNKNTYLFYHKYIKSSDVRKKIDDSVYETYKKYISKLMYLLIYKHVKANKLGYQSHCEFITKHTSQKMQDVFKNTIEHLTDRCNLELDILTKIKQTKENNSELNAWDIDYYMEQWKLVYGINDREISIKLDVMKTLINIFSIVEQLFGYHFTYIEKYQKLNKELMTFKISSVNDVSIGELTVDLYARDGKVANVNTVCINTRCFYPYQEKILQPLSMILHMNKLSHSGFTLGEFRSLINEIGKVIFYISNKSNYSIFGCGYAEGEYIDAFGRFFELIIFDGKILKVISNNTFDEILISKIIKYVNIDYGINYKLKCLQGMFDLFIHSNIDFINECKNIMTNIIKQNDTVESIDEHLCSIYMKMYMQIMNFNNTVNINTDMRHFHPIIWTFLYNGYENSQFLKILADIYANEIYKMYYHADNRKVFCRSLCNYIATVSNQQYMDIDKFIGHRPSVIPLFQRFNLTQTEELASIYNIDNSWLKENRNTAANKNIVNDMAVKNKKQDVVNDKKTDESKINSVFMQPKIQQKEHKTHKEKEQENFFEYLSESDPETRKAILAIMK